MSKSGTIQWTETHIHIKYNHFLKEYRRMKTRGETVYTAPKEQAEIL